MKKIFILMFVMILLVGTVSAFQLNPFGNSLKLDKEILEDTNDYLKSDFNEKYGTIRISKTFFWFETDRLAEYSLIENSDRCYYDCYAEGKAVLYGDSILFEEVNFKNHVGNNLEEVNFKVLIMGKINVIRQIAQYENYTFSFRKFSQF